MSKTKCQNVDYLGVYANEQIAIPFDRAFLHMYSDLTDSLNLMDVVSKHTFAVYRCKVYCQ